MIMIIIMLQYPFRNQFEYAVHICFGPRGKVWGEFSGGNFPQWEMCKVGTILAILTLLLIPRNPDLVVILRK